MGDQLLFPFVKMSYGTLSLLMPSVSCNSCGYDLENLDDPAGERTPCPDCGAKVRRFEVRVSAGIEMSDYVMMLQRRKEKNVGFRESKRNGRAASADDHGNGTLSYSLSGDSPQGEEDTLNVCSRLIQALNAQGRDVWQLSTTEGYADDGSAIDSRTPSRSLSIQVVRAVVDSTLWQELSQSGDVTRTVTDPKFLVDEIVKAIQLKANPVKLPDSVRHGLLLALDATRLPVFGFDSVIEQFRSHHSDWVTGLGFESVWLVGPTADLVWRLDDVS